MEPQNEPSDVPQLILPQLLTDDAYAAADPVVLGAQHKLLESCLSKGFKTLLGFD